MNLSLGGVLITFQQEILSNHYNDIVIERVIGWGVYEANYVE